MSQDHNHLNHARAECQLDHLELKISAAPKLTIAAGRRLGKVRRASRAVLCSAQRACPATEQSTIHFQMHFRIDLNQGALG